MRQKLLLIPIAALAVAACSETGPVTGPTTSFTDKPAFDDIPNTLDASVDAEAEVMSLVVGGPNGTTNLYVVPRNGDGKNGCNLTGSTTLVVGVNSSNSSVATAGPSTVTFSSCDDEHALTITPVGEGSAAISLSLITNTTDGTFDLTTATFTVNVSAPTPTNTPPSIAVIGVEGGASYNKGSVPAATCQVTDVEDGNPSFAATLSAISGPHASDGIGQQTASCSFADSGGLTANASVTYNIIDPSPPVIGYVLDPASPDGSNDWYVSDVTLTWTVTEAESPGSLAKTGCVDQNITSDQDVVTYTCSATSAGGTAGPVSVSIKRDATAPSVSLVGGPEDGASYYFGSVPAAPTCSASDALSGLDGACVVSGYSTAAGMHTVKATAKDNADNTAEASAMYTVLNWNLSGFYSPVNMAGLNTAKSGSTVPLKFEIFAGLVGENEQTDVAAVKSFVVQSLNCDVADDVGTEDAISQYSTGGTVLRYDAVAGQFVQNWQTPKNKAGYCYRVTMTALDGSTIVANFKLK